jgi:PAS domain S-box-containing protein
MSSSLGRVALSSILIIDDDPDIRTALTDLLTGEGYEVEAVNRGALAIQRVLERRFAAAILDIGLPDFDGLSILKVLTELDAIMPVIVLTGFITVNNTIGSLKKGAFAYLTKPYNQDEVRATVKRAVGVRDLSARSEDMQHDLRESLERFKAVVDSAPDAIVLADSSGCIFSWNATAERLFGYHSSEVSGQPLTLLMPERYRQPHTAGLLRLRSEGHRPVGRLLEVHGLKKDGHEFPIELSIASWTSKGETFYSGIIRDITGRKQAEAQLGAREEQLRLAMAASNLGVWDWDLHSNSMSYSTNFTGLFGFDSTFADNSYEGFLRTVHHADRRRLDDTIRMALNQRREFSTEFRVVWPDGTVRWIDAKGHVHVDSSSEPTRMVGVAMDITDRKRAEEALTKSEERYRALYEDNPCMYFTVSAEGIVRSVNRFGAEQLGYRPDELVGYSVLGVFHPDDQQHVVEELAAAFLHPDTPKYWEFRKVRKDGTGLWVRESVRIVEDPEGDPLALIVCEDITERKRAEDALRRQERELSDFFENGLLGHHWVGPTGIILRANQAELRMLGYRRDEYIGHQITEFHVDRNVIGDVFRRLERGETVNSYETTVRCKDGSTKEVLMDSNVLWDNGTFVHTRGFTRDISQQKRAEHRLSRMNECLLQLGIDPCDNILCLLDLCRELMAAPVALYYRRDGDSLASGCTWQFPVSTESESALDGSLCCAVLTGNEATPLVIRRIQDTHYAQTDPNVSLLQLQSFFGQAVKSSGVVSGSLCLLYHQDYAGLPGDNKLLGILASAIGVEETRQRAEQSLKRQERQLRQLLEEREQLSRDLHDGIIQSLYAVGLLLVDCQSTVPEGSPQRSMLQSGTSQLNGIIREIRHSIIEQHPPLMSISTFPLALRSLVQTMNGRLTPKFHLHLDDQLLTSLSSEQGNHLLYIVREALSNCLRHAQAATVTITFTPADDELCLKIEDDGQGFDLHAVGTSCMGLRNIQARAEKLETTVTIQSTKGQGTSIMLHLPMRVNR